MTPSHARAESEIEPANAIARATSPTILRSNISAIAPAGVDTSATGNINDVWTSATMPVDDESFVIAQAAPTLRIKRPRLDRRLAVQMRRNTAYRSGEKIPRADGARLFAEMLIIPITFATQAHVIPPLAGILGRRTQFLFARVRRHDRTVRKRHRPLTRGAGRDRPR